ncbi:MAG: hypothetical protein QXG58_05280 [Candidatus Bathyarchaeia archaeon]
MSIRERLSLRTLLLAFVLVVIGILLMSHGSNVLFAINPWAIFVMGLAVILIFAGAILMVVALAGLASV